MKRKTRVIRLPAGNISEIRKMPNGTLEVVLETIEAEVLEVEGSFVLIDAEGLSFDDEFMQWEPSLHQDVLAKKLVSRAIRLGVKNFYCSKYAPSFDENGMLIFEPNKHPAVGKSYNEWKEIAQKYRPEFNSRIGNIAEYGAFLGVLIKKLIENGMSIEDAWRAVGYDSKMLGHYSDSEDAKEDFECTGSRCVCGFYDLANTCKILSEDVRASGFTLAGGYYCYPGYCGPLADLGHCSDCETPCSNSVGWVILS